MKDECLICKAPLEYLVQDEIMECAICHKKELSKTRCVKGHYVCSESDVYVCGIATEYCVRNTCEDLLKAGFRVHLLKECLAYVDHDGHVKALEEMAAKGISIE